MKTKIWLNQRKQKFLEVEIVNFKSSTQPVFVVSLEFQYRVHRSIRKGFPHSALRNYLLLNTHLRLLVPVAYLAFRSCIGQETFRPSGIDMLVRIRSPNGNNRYELSPNDDISCLIPKILADCPEADPLTLTLSSQPRGGEKLLSSVSGTFSHLGIKHGDLLFASYQRMSRPPQEPSELSNSNMPAITLPASSSSQTNPSTIHQGWKNVKELEIDQLLEKEDGKISRKRDNKFCRHGDKSMCDYCMPLEPYDQTFHSERGIKHLSFQAFLRKLNAATNKPETGASYIPPLEEPDYQVVNPCPSRTHAPFPGGICSKCQPSAITLQLQSFRMVDHVEFITPSLIENLLVFWRKTGCQRFGYLLGKHERYDQVPLGVKAVVEAIHEPPQQGEIDGVQIGLPWEEEKKMEELASLCGLQVVGMIYTDLTPDLTSEEAKATGKVLFKRHAQSFFLSSLETIFAAHQQAARPNPSRFSASGQFSSKFVTCVITGNQEGGIDVSAYQASDQAVAMVKADMIEASVEPGTVRLKEEARLEAQSTATPRYIPDVFYRYKNKYGIDVKENAKPCFPVDYLLVSLTHGFPATSSPLFCSPSPFAIENRPGLHDQSMDLVVNQIRPVLQRVLSWFSDRQVPFTSVKGKGREQDEDDISELQLYLSDWHLLAFIDFIGIFDRNDIVHLINFALCRDSRQLQSVANSLFMTSSWQTFTAIVQESAPDPPLSNGNRSHNEASRPSDAHSSAEFVEDVSMSGNDLNRFQDLEENSDLACPHCTFVNPAGTTDCAVCGLPMS
ncbi:hypothetical protein O181_006091 [Austropuccinia psidii MF-1]|uniref:Nuclear protein localization protein 4 n=1 Tax=Austropuccinia psidii MF-1 TaxID=1389203 RepID=A0A9Q3GGG0_9BASI|nr:hypothetical protein [Austropuccinia psidii MF-1]